MIKTKKGLKAPPLSAEPTTDALGMVASSEVHPKVGCLCPVVRSIPMYIQTVLFGLSGLSKRKRRREGEERGWGE